MHKALIVVDIQNDFCPGGALAVPNGDEVVPAINSLVARYDHVVVAQDWHPAGHMSFASSHEGREPFETFAASYGEQVLWPDHCVQGTRGAEFHPDLQWTKAELLVRKGYDRRIDSYSVFFENDRTTPTGLAGYLKERGFDSVVLAGLATDFCVGFSALDAIGHGFAVTVVLDACRAIDLDGSLAAMIEQMKDAGVRLA
jgi:nicotinamidase/pyrazinamidase